jgi:hypothetical protein
MSGRGGASGARFYIILVFLFYYPNAIISNEARNNPATCATCATCATSFELSVAI